MRKIIYTVAIGDNECFKRCVKSQRQYAEKVKADFFVRLDWQDKIEELGQDSEKRFCMQLLKHYDKVLYLDADVLIKPNAENIFDFYADNNNLILYNEVLFNGVNMDTPIEKYAKDHNIKWHKTNGHYDWLNSGVILLTKNQNHELIFTYDPARFYKFPSHPGLYDMPNMHMNIYKHNIPVTFMDKRFNTMVYFEDKGDFLHFANVLDRDDRIKKYA